MRAEDDFVLSNGTENVVKNPEYSCVLTGPWLVVLISMRVHVSPGSDMHQTGYACVHLQQRVAVCE